MFGHECMSMGIYKQSQISFSTERIIMFCVCWIKHHTTNSAKGMLELAFNSDLSADSALESPVAMMLAENNVYSEVFSALCINTPKTTDRYERNYKYGDVEGNDWKISFFVYIQMWHI